MSVTSMRILVIGDLLPGTGRVLHHLTNAGSVTRIVRNVREARDLLTTFDFHVVLASEVLPDGRGYDLAESVSRRSRTLIVGVALSESSLWLPVVLRGVRVLGRRALSPDMLETELKVLLGRRSPDPHGNGVREIFHRPPLVPASAGLQRAGLMRRKFRDRDKESQPFA
jgi:DNA-binding response OmpR family regulator